MAKIEFGIDRILELLPHRYPMLLVDRVLEINPEANEVVAEKFVSINEPFFAGHFPDHPIMPGVLIVEALAQTAGIGVRYREESSRQKGLVLARVNTARCRRPARPGPPRPERPVYAWSRHRPDWRLQRRIAFPGRQS